MARKENIIIRVSSKEKADLAEVARKNGLSISEYVRMLIPVCHESRYAGTLTRYERDVLGLVMNSTMLLRKLTVSIGKEEFIKEVKEWSDEWLSENYDIERLGG